MPAPKNEVPALCDRVDAGTATPEDIAALSAWARCHSNWLAKIIARGVKAAEGRE